MPEKLKHEHPHEEEEPVEQAAGEYPTEGQPKYDTIKAEEIKYGTNNFIEVARKKIDDAEFLSISKGYYTKRGTRRYKNGLGFPDEEELKNFLINKLQKI